MAPLGTRSRPWEDLPMELVEAVVARLDVFSVTLLSAVCAPWARTVAAAKLSLPFGKPCLLASSKDIDRDDDRCCVIDLIDLAAAGNSAGEPLRRRFWVGSKGTWLATIDERCNLQLLNPYTNDRVDLPAISTIAGVEPSPSIRRRCGIRHLGSDNAFRKVVVCATPPASSAVGDGGGGYYLGIAIVAGRVLAVARGGGDRGWTALRNHRDMWAGYDDAIVHKGSVFAVDADGIVSSWDLTHAVPVPAAAEFDVAQAKGSRVPVQPGG